MAINRTKVLDAAQKYRRKGQLDRAIKEYVSLVEDDPSDMRTLLIIADLYVKTENPQGALESYKQVAYFYLRDDIYDKAVAVFKQAIGLAPQDALLRRDLGEAYHRMGRLKEAVSEYHHAQRLYEERGDLASQRDILERMVRLEPEEPALRIKLAEHYTKLKLHDEAVELFSYAARQFDEDGRLDDYLKVVERIVYLRPKDPELRARLATRYMEGGEYNRALKHLRACFEADPTSMETLRMMSVAFEQLQDFPKAVLVYGQLAKLFRDRGDIASSTQTYEQILRLDPNNQDARKMLAYDARQRQRQLDSSGGEGASRGAEDSSPGVHNTGNLRGAQVPRATTPQKPPSALPEIEFLDDDLGDVLTPSLPVVPPVVASPVVALPPVAPPRAQASSPPPPRPVVAPPPRPESSSLLGDDLLSFAADAIDELGEEIKFNAMSAYPGMPERSPVSPEIEPIEIEPLEIDAIELEPDVAPAEEDLDIRQAVDEARVFLKYGLRDRSIQTLRDIITRYPQALEAREELATVYLRYKERMLAVDQYMESAQIVRATPARVTHYLDLATQALGDRPRIEALAAQLGLRFGGAMPPQAELVELDLDDAPEHFSPSRMGGVHVAPRAAAESIIELSEMEFDLLEEEDSDEGLDTGQIDAQALATQDVPSLDFDTDDVIMDASIEEDAFDDVDMIELDDSPSEVVRPSGLKVAHRGVAPGSGGGGGFALSEDEADAMFNDLFGDAQSSPLTMSFSGSQDLAGLAEVDFLIEQGLASEAEDALTRIEQDNPHSNTLERRRLSLQNMRTEGAPSPNPFSGARSLSKQFSYRSVDDMAASAAPAYAAAADSVPSLIGAGDHAVNTNFELGAAYLEMGLLEEAIEEFSQSLYDPDVADSAAYNIAMCEVKLGRNAQAKQRLTQLLEESTTSAHVRTSATQLIARL